MKFVIRVDISLGLEGLLWRSSVPFNAIEEIMVDLSQLSKQRKRTFLHPNPEKSFPQYLCPLLATLKEQELIALSNNKRITDPFRTIILETIASTNSILAYKHISKLALSQSSNDAAAIKALSSLRQPLPVKPICKKLSAMLTDKKNDRTVRDLATSLQKTTRNASENTIKKLIQNYVNILRPRIKKGEEFWQSPGYNIYFALLSNLPKDSLIELSRFINGEDRILANVLVEQFSLRKINQGYAKIYSFLYKLSPNAVVNTETWHILYWFYSLAPHQADSLCLKYINMIKARAFIAEEASVFVDFIISSMFDKGSRRRLFFLLDLYCHCENFLTSIILTSIKYAKYDKAAAISYLWNISQKSPRKFARRRAVFALGLLGLQDIRADFLSLLQEESLVRWVNPKAWKNTCKDKHTKVQSAFWKLFPEILKKLDLDDEAYSTKMALCLSKELEPYKCILFFPSLIPFHSRKAISPCQIDSFVRVWIKYVITGRLSKREIAIFTKRLPDHLVPQYLIKLRRQIESRAIRQKTLGVYVLKKAIKELQISSGRRYYRLLNL